MTDNKKSRTRYWILTLLGFVGFWLLFFFLPQWIWLGIPPTVGAFALAMDWI